MRKSVEGASVAARVSVVVAVIFVLTFLVYAPGGPQQRAYAADYEQWEDCDWDGYDDHTGVEVPWPGFDGTKGDTPAGPSEDSQTGKKLKEEEEQQSPSSGSESGSSSPSEAPSEKKKSGTKKETKKETKTSDSKKDDSDKTDASEETKADTAEETASDAALAGTDAEDAAPVADTSGKPDPSAVAAQGGSIAVKAEGSEDGTVEAGGAVTIEGAGFFGDVADLRVEIHSTPQILGNVNSDASGAFSLTVALPKDFEPGAHEIVVYYDELEIAKQAIEVVAPAVASDSDNAGTNRTGVIILIALAAAAAAAIIVVKVRGKRKAAQAGDPSEAVPLGK